MFINKAKDGSNNICGRNIARFRTALHISQRELADRMLALCLEVAPHLFKQAGPPCVSGACPEGKMSCGKILEIREKYKLLREENS